MSADRRNYWRHALLVNHTCDRRIRSDLRDRNEQHEWLASRRVWQNQWPWQDGRFPQ